MLLQLADETVAASNLAANRRRCGLRVGERSSCAAGWQHAAVSVSRLDSGPVKNENDEQQSDAAFQDSAVVLNCLR